MHIASIVKIILTTIQLKRCFREERNPRGLWKGCLKKVMLISELYVIYFSRDFFFFFFPLTFPFSVSLKLFGQGHWDTVFLLHRFSLVQLE